jgi:hypothetical protein
MTTSLRLTDAKGSRLVLAAAALALGTVGCNAANGDEPPVETESAYLLGTRVWDDVSTTSFFHVVSTLEADTQIDESEALEVPGAAKLYSVPGLGWFALGGGEAPTITRYTLEEGSLVAGDQISLLDYGVASLWDTLYVVSRTKAYYPDRERNQLIIWNPSEMTVTGSLALPEAARSGYLSFYGYAPILRDDMLLVSVGWFDWDDTDSILGETGLLKIDTATDAVVGFETDDRCGGVTQPVTTASGDTVLVSSAMAAAAHDLGRLPTEPCALRVRAGETSFDADYAIKLADMADGALAGEPIPAGGDAVFLRVFDPDLATVEEGAATWEITGQSAWRWARWDVSGSEFTALETLEPSTADVMWFQVDGRVFGTETKDDYSETTLLELTADEGPRRALAAPGFLHGVARIR